MHAVMSPRLFLPVLTSSHCIAITILIGREELFRGSRFPSSLLFFSPSLPGFLAGSREIAGYYGCWLLSCRYSRRTLRWAWLMSSASYGERSRNRRCEFI